MEYQTKADSKLVVGLAKSLFDQGTITVEPRPRRGIVGDVKTHGSIRVHVILALLWTALGMSAMAFLLYERTDTSMSNMQDMAFDQTLRTHERDITIEELRAQMALLVQQLAEADEFRADMVRTLERVDEIAIGALSNKSIVDAIVAVESYDQMAQTGLSDAEARRAWFDARVVEILGIIRDKREGASDGNTQRTGEDNQEGSRKSETEP